MQDLYEEDKMLGVWFIICVIFLTVFRYIWKRKENNPCMLFSYFLYLYDVTGLFYYVLVGKCRVKILYLLIVLFMVILQIGLPFLFNHIGRDNRVIKVLKNWHEQVDEFVYVLGNVDPVISSKWRMGDQRGILYYVISGKCFLYGDEKAAGIHLGNAYASEYCRLLCLYYMYDRCKIR